mgnify:CR=1 FL=1|jgi:hypothetical protein
MRKACDASGNVVPLIPEDIERLTGKCPPYFTTIIKGGKPQLRIAMFCPKCHLGVLVLAPEKATRYKPAIGRHQNHLPGICEMSDTEFQAKYENCPYAKPRKFDTQALDSRRSKKTDELLEILINEYDIVCAVLGKSIGISLHRTLRDDIPYNLLRDCLAAKRLMYVNADQLNLPWTFALCTNAFQIGKIALHRNPSPDFDLLKFLTRCKVPFTLKTLGKTTYLNCPSWYRLAFLGHLTKYSKAGEKSDGGTREYIEICALQILPNKEVVTLGRDLILVDEDLWINFRRYLKTQKRNDNLLNMAKSILTCCG